MPSKKRIWSLFSCFFSIDFLNKTKENTSMSTAPIDSGGSGGGLHRLLSRISNISQRANSVGVTEIGTSLSTGSSIESNPTDQENVDHSWIKHFNQIDRLFSGSLLQLIYRAIDISLLLTGLLSNSSPCETSNHFGITSICLLIFYFIDIFIIFLLFLRNISSRHLQMSEEQKNDQLRRALVLRGFFTFFKLIPIAVGTAYVFPSSSIKPVECNSMRFYLGLVCMSTWLIILIPPSKPEVPVRRSFILELFVLLFVLIINLTYIGTVARSISGVNQTSCLYHQMNDMYYGAPLKSFAYVGLILFSCTTLIHLIHVFVNQICFRLSTQRQRWFISYYAFQYTLNYFSAIVVIYYFSTGALILFQPVEGEPCRNSAPDLYRILLIWEWIRILSPLIVLPLLIIFCCLGVCFGIIFSFCLPPSITVPLLESLRVKRRKQKPNVRFEKSFFRVGL